MPTIDVKQERTRVEQLIGRYESVIGEDFAAYRNHVYRTITYAMHFLGNAEEHEPMVETAFVYHDIGLWTDKELAYLGPSEKHAIDDNQKYGWGLDPDVLRDVIHWHHKIFRYHGPHQDVVEACRKGDWIDATKGKIRKGMSKENIAKVEAAYPNLGFHDRLVRLAKDYRGSTLLGLLQVGRGIIKW